MAKLSNLGYTEANGLFTTRRSAAAAENTNYYLGDHLQEGSDFLGYIGERPPAGENYGEFMNRVKAAFVSRNCVKEFCDRHTNGVLGREPLWRFAVKNVSKDKTTKEQKNTIAAAEDALTEIWNDKEFLLMLQKTVTTALLEEKCVVRPFILPKSLTERGELIKTKTISGALKMIRFEVVTSDKAGVFEDEETFEDIGIYKFEDEKTKQKRAEITYLKDGITYLRTVESRDLTGIKNDLPTLRNYISGAETFGAKTYSLGDLGGRLFLYEFKREPLISEQVRSLQKCLNLDLTMMMRNINLAGFRQKTITNAQKPLATVVTVDENGNPVIEKREVPMRSGLLSTPFLNGLPIKQRDAQGNEYITGYTNPNINIADPVAVDTFVESLAVFYEAMLSEVYQLHVAIAGDAMASGKSRIEARAEFEKSLQKTKTALDALGRWLLEVSLRFAANLCGQNEFLDLRCDFNSIVDAGTPDAAERDQNIKEWQAGGISTETMMSRNGIEDTDVETAKIQADAGYKITMLGKVLDVIAKSSGVLPLSIQLNMVAPYLDEAILAENPAAAKLLEQLAKEDSLVAQAYGMTGG
jgi:hypothetical protein